MYRWTRLRFVCALGLVPLLAAPLVAEANGTATVSLGPIQVEATTLLANDDRPVLYEFGLATGSLHAGVGGLHNALWWDSALWNGSSSPARVDGSIPMADVHARVDTAGLSASAQAAPASPDMTDAVAYGTYANWRIQMAPHTRLEITVPYDFELTVDGLCAPSCAGAFGKAFFSWASLADTLSFSGPNSQPGLSYIWTGRNALADGPGTTSRTGDFSVLLGNESAEWRQVYFQMDVDARVLAQPYPVPEPSSFALLGIGLAALVARLKRRSTVRLAAGGYAG